MTPFEAVIDQFGRKCLLVVGDIMLDRFVYGTVSRISPEAPAPVINTAAVDEIIGGAGNVARNIASLGGRCDLVAVIGCDEGAVRISQCLEAYPGIVPALIKIKERATTVKTRFVAFLHNTHLLRADTEETAPVSRETEDLILSAVHSRLDSIDAIILSDYGKGVLTTRVIAEIISAANRVGKPTIVDPKGIEYSRYRGATVITPNVSEVLQALGRPIKNDEGSLREAAVLLMDLTGCEKVLITRGERGVLIVQRDGTSAAFDATAKRVVDISGAGDTLVASFVLALVSDAGPINSARLGNSAAGIVVSKKGTSQVTVDELRDVLLSRPHFELRGKLHNGLSSLDESVAEWRKEGLTIGFTNGCFDLLHPGHVQLLCEARSYCDRLIVGLNSDSSVRRLKGPTRPIQSEAARSIVIAGLAFVDAVILFDSDTPTELIARFKPDVLVKGADYRIEQVVGREIVNAYGGRIVLIELVPDSSTTRIVEKLKSGSAVAGASREAAI
jgi:D-beta-D-heptose 7-phosphate kinase/D-beta-D-heptose 1-phosphate adenosyltransferase